MRQLKLSTMFRCLGQNILLLSCKDHKTHHETAWPGNWTWDCFLAFAWQGSGEERLLVAVNYAPNRSQCYVHLPSADFGNGLWRFQDQMGPASYDRAGDDLRARGFYLDMGPWGYHVFKLQKLP